MKQFSILFLFFFILEGAAHSTYSELDHCQQPRPNQASVETIAELLGVLETIPGKSATGKKLAAIYGTDNRKLVTPSYPHPGLGRFWRAMVDKPCTANRISACHILTASHCVLKTSNGNYRPMGFQPPFEDKAYMVDRTAVLAGTGNFDVEHVDDWAILRLDDVKSGLRDGWMCLKNVKGSELVGKTLAIAGYHKDLSPTGRDAYVDEAVKVIRTDEKFETKSLNYIFYRANTDGGSSGGAIIEVGADGKACIVGINAAGWDEEGKNVTLPANEMNLLAAGVASGQFFDRVQKFMNEYPCKF